MKRFPMKVMVKSPASAGLGLALLLLPGALAAEGFTLDTAQAAAAKGDPQAEYFLGKQYAHGQGVPQDYAKAAEYFRQAATQGCALAQNDLGAFYAKGLGVKQDDETAVQWYRRAAEQGDPLAEYSLGHDYALGRGVSKDMSEALKWYRKAADQNQPDALATLGDLYFFGDQGITLDYQAALKYYSNAVVQGRLDCLNNLGFTYEQVEITNLAVKCYREAVARGDGRAMMNLGLAYKSGMGVQADSVEAYKWFILAVRHGAIAARHYVAELDGASPLVKSHLSAVQIAEAMRRVNNYTPVAAKAPAPENGAAIPEKHTAQ